MRSEMRVQKKQESSVAMTVWVFMIGINSAMKKAGFKNLAENSPVLVREMNRLFLSSEA